MTKEQMRVEAIKRLDYLMEEGLFEEVKSEFEKGVICYSKPVNPYGLPMRVVFPIDGDSKIKEIVDEFNKRSDYLGYYCLDNETPYGRKISLLTVSKYKSEWKEDLQDLKAGEAYAYVHNVEDDFGEIGLIGVKVAGGGLRRIF